jgi:5'-methylthioadenosine nucleosidase
VEWWLVILGYSHNVTYLPCFVLTCADASVKDMEAAAIAWTTELTGTPFLTLKVVTDIVDGGRPTNEEFMENLATAAASLQNTIFKMLDFIIGKKLSDL